MTNATSDLMSRFSLRDVLRIPAEVLDEAMATAYRLYTGGRFHDCEIICRGLLAADPTYWWVHSLYAATLQKLGRFQDALVAVERGLGYEPGHPKLTALRDEIKGSINRVAAAVRQAHSKPNQKSDVALSQAVV